MTLLLSTTFADALIAITAILAVFGLGGFIVLKILQLIREAIASRRPPVHSDSVFRKLEQYEQRQEQLIKRVQNLETIVVDADLANRETDSAGSRPDDSEGRSGGPLANRLR